MKKLIKFHALFLSVLFLASTAMAKPSIYDFTVPDKIGKVKERYRGTSDSVVIHIQDAHKSSEAQKNIANIIEFLIRKEGLSLVGAEGGFGEQSVSQFESIPLESLKRSVGFEFVKKGFLTGDEYAKLIASKDFDLIGLEDEESIVKNIAYFLDTKHLQEEAAVEFLALQEAVYAVEPSIFNENLMAFVTTLESYEDRDIDFIDYSSELIAKAKELDIDLFEYVELSQYTEYIVQKNQLDLEAVQAEKEDLLDIIDGRKGELDEESAYNKLESALSGQNRLFTEKEVQELIISLAVKLSVPKEQYASLQKNIELERRFQLFNIGNLIKEADNLTYVVLDKLATNSTEKKLIEIRRDILTTYKMINLDALKSDTDFFKSRKDSYVVESWYQFLNDSAKKNDVELSLSRSDMDYKKLFDSVAGYYKEAIKRDESMSKNMIDLMSQKNVQIAAMVCGGYHTQGITDYFRSVGQSYVVIMPRITTAAEDIPLESRMDGSLYGVDMAQAITEKYGISTLAATSKS